MGLYAECYKKSYLALGYGFTRSGFFISTIKTKKQQRHLELSYRELHDNMLSFLKIGSLLKKFICAVQHQLVALECF